MKAASTEEIALDETNQVLDDLSAVGDKARLRE